jgi:hypothetical protein
MGIMLSNVLLNEYILYKSKASFIGNNPKVLIHKTAVMGLDAP